MKRLRILLTLPVLTIAITLAINASNTSSTVYAAPATFTVTNTNDTGAGSLRQAIIDANSNGNPGDQDIINFNISGAGDKLIQPQSQLTITQSVLINGYTQGDATPNTQPWPEAMDGTIRVEIDNSVGGPIVVNADNVELRGLTLNKSLNSDLVVTDSANFRLSGCYFGTDITGSTGRYNGSNGGTQPQIALKGVVASHIGGTLPSQRNVVAYSKKALISIMKSGTRESSNIAIQGNNIGIGSDSLTVDLSDQSPGAGIKIQDESSNITIGGNDSTNGNTIMGLGSDSGRVEVGGNSNKVFIANNVLQLGRFGVVVSENAQKVAIVHNTISLTDSLAIDLGANTVPDVNDPNDTDSGPNDMLNSPGYTQIVEDGGNTEVTFSIDVPAGDYKIEFYSNPYNVRAGGTYLGSTNITSSGTGLQEFSHTLTGTGHTNLALTATEIDPSTPSGFGATSEFGGSGQGVPVSTDLSIRKSLLNPQDYAVGNTLDYQITIRNNGHSSVDLSQLNDPNPAGNSWLFQDVLPPNLTYTSINGDVQCIYLGDGSAVAYGPILADHSTYGIVVCAYDGVSPRILESGDSISFTLHATVTDDSNPNFTNYAIVTVLEGEDPDAGVLGYAFENGIEILTAMETNPINNIAAATSTPADVSVAYVIAPNQDLQVGGPLKYLVTFTNHGASPIDPTQFNAGGLNPAASALFIGALPPNSSFVSSSNPDVTCSDMGGATFGDLNAGAAFTDVVNHKLVICAYTGSNHALGPGQSITTTLNATLNSLPSQFSSYILANGSASDPDDIAIKSIPWQNKPLFTTALARGINNVAKAIFDSHYYDQDNDGTPDDLEDIINGNTNGLSKPPPINTRKVASNYPSNGDGNGDGTPDRQQSNVTTIINPVTGYPITLEAKGDCQTIDHFTVKAEGDLQLSDAGYNYPVGLNDFRLSCATPGGTSTVTVYYDRAYDTSKWIPRKYIDNKYHDLGSAKIGTAEVNGLTVSTITYDLTDGGNLDSDHQANGVITDPAGPATPAPLADNLADTTSNVVKGKNWWILIVGIVILLTTILIFFILRRRKNQQNQQTSINNNWRG